MTDYYDRLGAQLAELTARGTPRRFRLPGASRSFPRLRLPVRPGTLAVAASVAVAAAVAVVFLAAGASRRSAPPPGKPLGLGAGAPPVFRNYAHGSVPRVAGVVVCETKLFSPDRAASPWADAEVFAASHGRYVLEINASGLKPTTGKTVYAVWLNAPLSPTWQLVGEVRPPVGADGQLRGVGRLPVVHPGGYALRVTLQRSASAPHPQRTVLEGSVLF
jgi:hypothetical protein